ncbi:hypothetical protein vseg_015057 [Gypsophila vaccaria]
MASYRISSTTTTLLHHKRPHLSFSISPFFLKLKPPPPPPPATSPLIISSTISTPKFSHSTPPHFHFYPSSLLCPPSSTKGTSDISPHRGLKTVLWVLLWASVSVVVYAFSPHRPPSASAAAAAAAADSSIKASNVGLQIAGFLRGFGWPDELVVFCLATLPVLELRGAIPLGYWLHLPPLLLTVLSILGNMLPVPFIILYLKKLATFIAGKNRTLSKLLDMLFERAKNKAGPIEEFQWLGLMLFVAVPFPGTGAWTGAIIASVLDMPFWPAVSANFFGVVIAGLLVNLLVNLGLKYAVITGIILFFVSTFMWSILRNLGKPLTSPK